MKELRGKRVAQMINDLEDEGIAVSASDEAMLRAYVRGTISGPDLLTHATQFDDLSSYQDWLHSRLSDASQANASEVSVEQLVREVEIGLRRGSERRHAEGGNTPVVYQAVTALLRPFRLGVGVLSSFGRVDSPSMTV